MCYEKFLRKVKQKILIKKYIIGIKKAIYGDGFFKNKVTFIFSQSF